MADVFISYASPDRAHAREFAEALHLEGLSVWFDQRLEAADIWDQAIDREIRSCGVVITLWTPSSVGSRWVRSEADFAFEKGKLLPVRMAACELPLAYRLVQAIDLQPNGQPLRDRENWSAFVTRVRQLFADNRSLSERELAEIDRAASRNRRRDGLVRFGLKAFAGVFLSALALGAFGVWQWWRSTHVSFEIASAGMSMALGGLRADVVASEIIYAQARNRDGQVWSPFIAMADDRIAVSVGDSLHIYRRQDDTWQFDPLDANRTCPAESPSDAPCGLRQLQLGHGRDETTAVLHADANLDVWFHGRHLSHQSQNCLANSPPTACGVTAFAIDAFEGQYAFATAGGAVYAYWPSRFPDESEVTLTGGNIVSGTGDTVHSMSFGPGNQLIAVTAYGIAYAMEHAARGRASNSRSSPTIRVLEDGCAYGAAGVSADGARVLVWCTAGEQDRLTLYERGGENGHTRVDRIYFPRSDSGGGPSSLLLSTSGISALLLDTVGAGSVVDLTRGRVGRVGRVIAALDIRLRGRDAFVTVGDDARRSVQTGEMIGIWDSTGDLLASAEIPHSAGAAIDAGPDAVWVAASEVYTGKLSLWRVHDGGEPLVDVIRRAQ